MHILQLPSKGLAFDISWNHYFFLGIGDINSAQQDSYIFYELKSNRQRNKEIKPSRSQVKPAVWEMQVEASNKISHRNQFVSWHHTNIPYSPWLGSIESELFILRAGGGEGGAFFFISSSCFLSCFYLLPEKLQGSSIIFSFQRCLSHFRFFLSCQLVKVHLYLRGFVVKWTLQWPV